MVEPNVLTPIIHVFLLGISLIQNRRDSLAFEIVSLGWISGRIESNLRVGQNFWTGVSYILKELRT